MNRSLLKIQVLILGVGTAFSWTTLVFDYRRLFSAGGGIVEFSGCAVTNPLATPCFYGTSTYLSALLVSAALRRAPGGLVQRPAH